MRQSSRALGVLLPAVALAVTLAGLLPSGAVAEPQEEKRQVRREVVVVGSQPAHRRLILDHLANRVVDLAQEVVGSARNF